MLSDLGALHPEVVHFVIALLILGVLLRLVSLTGRLNFTSAAAALLLILGAFAAVVAVQTGDAAHGVAEAIPGARAAVVEHEEWGERTRNVFLVVAALEIIALILAARAPAERRRPGVGSGWARGIRVASGLIGLAGLFALYETGEHGGEVVYAYAGGVGTRSGSPADVDRLYLAGLYQKAMLERKQGHPAEAARLFGELKTAFPNDPEVQLVAARSKLEDEKDAHTAIAEARAIQVPQENNSLWMRRDFLVAEAFQALSEPDSARAVLQALDRKFPNNPRITGRLEKLGR